jgi:outer membrane protein OmpA-like peptidoglycan-associated protein
MVNMASSSEGANNLANMMREGGYEGLSENPMSLFRGGTATNYLLSAGERYVGRIFTGDASSVTELVARSGGVTAASAKKLMALITPLTMGVLGKRISQAPGSSELALLLSRQRDEIESAAPAGLARNLGLEPKVVSRPDRDVELEALDFPTHIEHSAEPTPASQQQRVEATAFTERPPAKPIPFPKAPAIVVERPAPEVPRLRGGGGLRWLPFVMLTFVAIALFGYLLSRSRAPRISNLAGRDISAATNTLANVALPGGVNLAVPQNSINYRLAAFLGDNSAAELPKTFVFDHLSFVSGSTQLTRDSDKTVKDLALILNAYPNSHVQLTGHTDGSRDPQRNQSLSLERANALKAMLVNNGVAADRISTQGLGPEESLGSNDTEEAKDQNRRTELTVTQK